jgi:hypothetical protein
VVRKNSLPDPLVRRRDSALRVSSGVDTGLVYRPPDFRTEEGPSPSVRLDHGRVAGAVGIFFTWRGQRQTREAQEQNQQNTQAQLRHAQEQLKNAQEELRLTREGQITERFTRAIEQLGATHDNRTKNLELRLGGIYALARIARESEEDHWPIMEVLTAYVRQHAPLGPEQDQEGAEDATAAKKSEEDSRGATEITKVPAPEPDIQAIMTVIRRRTRYYGHGELEYLDLHETNLTGADLSGADLSGADLSGASGLMQAQLDETNGDEDTRLPFHLKPPRTLGRED